MSTGGPSRSGLPFARLAAEFGVIVLGVLVALLAESAWQERGERVEEREALVRIRAELAAHSADIVTAERLVALLLPIQETAADVLRGDDALDDRARLAVLYGAILRNQTFPREGSWQDLAESGRTDLIADPELRGRLRTFYQNRARLMRDLGDFPTALRNRVIAALPVEYTTSVLDECVRMGMDAFLMQGAREDAAEALRTCDVVPPGGTAPYLERIRALPDADLALGELRYSVRIFDEQVVRTRTVFDSLVVALDRTLEEGR